MTFEFDGKAGICGEISHLMRIGLKIIKFLGGAGAKEDVVREFRQSAISMALPEKLNVIPVVPVLGLQQGTVG